MEWRAQVWQDGMVVAAVSGPNEDQVKQEIGRYFLQYLEEGPATIRIIKPRTKSALARR